MVSSTSHQLLLEVLQLGLTSDAFGSAANHALGASSTGQCCQFKGQEQDVQKLLTHTLLDSGQWTPKV